jgi:hypothetical protein
VERDATAGRGDDLRDPGPHLTGADDEDVLELHGAAGYRPRHAPRRERDLV